MAHTPSACPEGPARKHVKPLEWSGVALILFIYIWLGARGDQWRTSYEISGQKTDYYNLLVDGMLEGHLYMKVSPGPDGKMPYILDASLYHGKYYLYFGVVPAVTLFLPYSILTGQDLPENAAAVILVAGGFLLSWCLYVLCRTRYCPDLPRGLNGCILALLAFGAGTPMLIIPGSVYEIAQAGGYLCMTGTLLGIYQALHTPRKISWLALASLFAGLAVGCRPNYIVALPLIFAPVWWQFRNTRGDEAASRRRTLLALLGAAVIPAGCVGLLLMEYNRNRFGDAFEPGFRYQINELMRTGMPLASVRFIWTNLQSYYFRTPVLSPYFPYFLPICTADRPALYYGTDLLHGQWLATVLAIWCLATVLWLRFKRRPWPEGLLIFNGCCLAAFMILLLVLSTFGIGANRYLVDCQGTLVLLLTTSGVFAASELAVFAPAAGRLFRTGFGLLAVALALFNVCAGLQWREHLVVRRPLTFNFLSRYGNLPAYWSWRLHPAQFQSYRLKVKFARPEKVREEVLLATGTFGYLDELFVTQQPNGMVSFAVAHTGHTAIGSVPIKLDFDREHELDILIGSFFPAREHPFFARWTPADVIRARTTTRVLLDGVEIIDGNQAFFNGQPGRIYWGTNPWGKDRPFSGRITKIEPQPLPGPNAMQASHEFGLWRFTWQVHPFSGQQPQPLLASGTPGAGNLLLLEHVAPNTICLAHDEWSYGLTRSPRITIDPDRLHTLEVFVGPQVAKQALPADWKIEPAALQRAAGQLKVWIDGTLVWDTAIRGNLQSYDFVAAGKNPQGFSSAIATYIAILTKQPLLPDDRREFLLRSLAPEASAEIIRP